MSKKIEKIDELIQWASEQTSKRIIDADKVNQWALDQAEPNSWAEQVWQGSRFHHDKDCLDAFRFGLIMMALRIYADDKNFKYEGE